MKLQKDGWMEGAERVLSPHYDARPEAGDISLLVVHGISLPPNVFGGDQVSQLFCGGLDCDSHPYFAKLKGLRVSAHFFIRRGGELIQFVSCQNRAWHAGASQWRGRECCNDFSLGAELEGADDVAYEPAQYAALAKLHAALCQTYSPLAVVGHEHISSGRKTDPGPAFDWQKLFTDIGREHDGRPA